jgi:hypothetical protein
MTQGALLDFMEGYNSTKTRKESSDQRVTGATCACRNKEREGRNFLHQTYNRLWHCLISHALAKVKQKKVSHLAGLREADTIISLIYVVEYLAPKKWKWVRNIWQLYHVPNSCSPPGDSARSSIRP